MKSVIENLKRPVRLKIFGKDRHVPLVVILAGVSLVVVFFAIRYVALQDKWRTLNVEWHGYSIDYPALWSPHTYPASGGRGENLDYLSATISSTGLSIYIYQMQIEQPTLTKAFEWGQKIVQGWKASNISSTFETQIGHDHYPALAQTYYDRGKLTKAFFVVSENRVYMIEFTRVGKNSQPIIDRMLASFRLYDGGNE